MSELLPTEPSSRPDPFPPLDREEYLRRCAMRWSGDALRDARGNWKHWQEHRAMLNAAMLRFLTSHKTLTEFLWDLQAELKPGGQDLHPLLDFCEHYQRVHLRRGLLIYCEFILKALSAAEPPSPRNPCETCGRPLEESGVAGSCCACIREAERPVLFLDVDGVLNRCGKSATRLEPDLIDNLVHIVEQTDCRIVVSSTWRWMPGPMKELTHALEDRGLSIASSTPVHQIRTEGGIYTSTVRGGEIQAWMDEHGTPSRFCIVDDDGDMAHLKHALVRTNSFDGLTPDHASRIIDALNGPPSQS